MADDHLVLGLAAGYHYGDVRPFLTSLNRCGHAGRCVLFVSETTRDVDRMAAHGATVIRLDRPKGLEAIPYNGLRYFLYREYLAKHPAERILLADVRDVIFQAAPFGHPWADGLNVTLEDGRVTIGQCPHNSHWVRGHLGEAALTELAAHPISCSGTTVGDREAMTAYLDAMTSRLREYRPAERMAGYDQAIHNHLIRTDALAEVTLHDNDGPILTLGYTEGEPKLDDAGFVLNRTGRRPVIVHQYDRKPNLFKHIRQIYAA